MVSDDDRGGTNDEPPVHARVVVRPVRDCPVTRLATDCGLRGLVPPSGEASAPQAIVECIDATTLRAHGARPTVRTDESTVCRLPTLEAAPEQGCCRHDHCLARGVDFLPIAPYHRR